MKAHYFLAVAAAFSVGASQTAAAQAQSSQAVTFTVQQVSELAAIGSPSISSSATATAGSMPMPVIDNSASLALTANTAVGETRKVTVTLDQNMPTGTALSLQAEAPAAAGPSVSGGTSIGFVQLTTMPIDLITGITGATDPSVQLTYILTNTAEARVAGPQTRTVTFTLTAGAGGGAPII